MRLVIQRVREASVSVGHAELAAIKAGFLVFVGVGQADKLVSEDMAARTLLNKMLSLRLFPDAEGKMNLGLTEFGGELLIISQFTLYADCSRGRRPSFHMAGEPQQAEAVYQSFVGAARVLMPGKVQQGVFGADMDIRLLNWGPVTILLESQGAHKQL